MMVLRAILRCSSLCVLFQGSFPLYESQVRIVELTASKESGRALPLLLHAHKHTLEKAGRNLLDYLTKILASERGYPFSTSAKRDYLCNEGRNSALQLSISNKSSKLAAIALM